MSATIDRAVCVYCASSDRADPRHRDDARRLGALLAADGRTVVYGGGRVGSMGALAAGALQAGGRVVGIIPGFLRDLELAHDRLTELHVVEDLRSRKHEMLVRSAAVVALPGGCGTFEELLEVVTLKRLGVYLGPIVIVNTEGYYAPLLDLFAAAVREQFMRESDAGVFSVVATPDEVLEAIRSAPVWRSPLEGRRTRGGATENA
jgi:hypothetical protein